MRNRFYKSTLRYWIFLMAVFFTGVVDGSTPFYAHPEVDNRHLNPQNSDNAYPASLMTKSDSIAKFKKLALGFSQQKDAEKASVYLLKYLAATGDLTIINDHLFEPIVQSSQYQRIKTTFAPDFNLLSVVYIFAGFLGIFIFILMLVRKGKDRVGNTLIGLFILFHSIFLLHLSLYITNTQYYLPQALFASTIFSFLYGPLLYFYFRRVTTRYTFNGYDLLHLLPTLLLIVYLGPYLLMSQTEKFEVLLNQGNLLLPMANSIITVKLISLIVYGLLSLELYRKHSLENRDLHRNVLMWQRNMIVIYGAYTAAYCIYSGVVTGIIPVPTLLHLQVLVMVVLVFYVAYISYVQPEIFKGRISLVDPKQFFKYKKSRLTPAFSEELKERMLVLLNEEKIFKQNDINLERLSEKLDTNRHNASQVINEHFNMNFFELINKYRISEAVRILEEDAGRTHSIIEVAYEVGFNNKVTFNKSFKKFVSKTPSQFILSLQIG